MSKRIDLVLSGSGTLAPCHVGAVNKIKEYHTIARVAGTSGGALVAASVAFGMSYDEQMLISKEVFADPTILDRSWTPWDRAGIHNGDRILKILKKYFPGTMSDSNIPWGVFVSDLWTRKPVFINSKDHPDVPVAEALRASVSIPLWFKAVKITGFKDHLFVDGGVEANLGMSIFDDSKRETIGVTFSTKTNTQAIKPWAFVSIVRAVLSMLMDNINNSYKSEKKNQTIVRIDTNGDGMDFSLSEHEIYSLSKDGYRSVTRQLAQG